MKYTIQQFVATFLSTREFTVTVPEKVRISKDLIFAKSLEGEWVSVFDMGTFCRVLKFINLFLLIWNPIKEIKGKLTGQSLSTLILVLLDITMDSWRGNSQFFHPL